MRPSSTSAAAPTCTREYGAYARVTTSRGRGRRASQSGVGGHRATPAVDAAVGRRRSQPLRGEHEHQQRGDVGQEGDELGRDVVGESGTRGRTRRPTTPSTIADRWRLQHERPDRETANSTATTSSRAWDGLVALALQRVGEAEQPGADREPAGRQLPKIIAARPMKPRPPVWFAWYCWPKT